MLAAGADSPPTIQYPLELAGVVTRVVEVGTGDDVVVCLHGAGSRADRWRPAMELMARAGRHCYAIDYPGHGLAAKPAGYAYSCPAFADVAVALVDHLGREQVAVAGTSIGGYIAGLTALARPDRVSSLALIGSVGLAEVERVTAASGDIGEVTRDGIRQKLEFLVHDPALVTERWVEEEWRINSSPGAAEALAALQVDNARRREPIGPDVAALGLPTLLCWGAEDRWIPVSDGHASHAVMPSSPLLLLAGTAHAPYFERPQAFVDAYLGFLDDPASLGVGVTTI